MEREVKRLARVLRRVAHEAGWALLGQRGPDVVPFCIGQYNRIRNRLGALDPALATSFGTLPEEASAGQVRILARALAASLAEKAREERRRAWADFGGFGFFWPRCGFDVDCR